MQNSLPSTMCKMSVDRYQRIALFAMRSRRNDRLQSSGSAKRAFGPVDSRATQNDQADGRGSVRRCHSADRCGHIVLLRRRCQGNGGSASASDQSFEAKVEPLRERQRTLTGVLVALPGLAAGAGLAIALACDIRVTAQSAFVSTGCARIGLTGDYGAPHANCRNRTRARTDASCRSRRCATMRGTWLVQPRGARARPAE